MLTCSNQHIQGNPLDRMNIDKYNQQISTLDWGGLNPATFSIFGQALLLGNSSGLEVFLVLSLLKVRDH